MIELLTAAVAALIIVGTIVWYTDKGVFTQSAEEEKLAEEQCAAPALMSDMDRRMAESTKACIRRTFGRCAAQEIMEMGADLRRQASDSLIAELCSLYHISLSEVTYFCEETGDCGGYHPSENRIELNLQYMLSDDPACILLYLDTIVHELRHKVQWSILEGGTFWDTPEETQKTWYANMSSPDSYIRPWDDRRAYITQPIERDAITFAHYAMEGVC